MFQYASVRELISNDLAIMLHSHPTTSTPFVRRPAVAKGRQSTTTYSVKVNVHDGLAMRLVPLKSTDSLMEVLVKVVNVLQRAVYQVKMGYDAPWSAKVGTKKVQTYITTDEELEEFWVAYDRYLSNLGPKKKKDSGGEISGIVFCNMNDVTQVRTR